jgi:hypothetical protein
MKLVLHKFKTLKFDEHESRTLERESSAKCMLRHTIAKARWKLLDRALRYPNLRRLRNRWREEIASFDFLLFIIQIRFN